MSTPAFPYVRTANVGPDPCAPLNCLDSWKRSFEPVDWEERAEELGHSNPPCVTSPRGARPLGRYESLPPGIISIPVLVISYGTRANEWFVSLIFLTSRVRRSLPLSSSKDRVITPRVRYSSKP